MMDRLLLSAHAIVRVSRTARDVEGLSPAHSLMSPGHWESNGIKIWRRKKLFIKSCREGRGSVMGHGGLKEVTDRGLRPSQGVPLLDVSLVMRDQTWAMVTRMMETIMMVSTLVLGEVKHLVLIH